MSQASSWTGRCNTGASASASEPDVSTYERWRDSLDTGEPDVNAFERWRNRVRSHVDESAGSELQALVAFLVRAFGQQLRALG